MANLKISGIINQDARIKVMDDNIYIGYKDVSAGAYQVVFPDQRPNINPDDEFTGNNGDPPDDTRWQILTGAPEIQSNKLSMAHGAGEGNVEQILSRFVLTGNFNINMLADMTAVPQSNYTYLEMRALSLDNLNGGVIRIRTQSTFSDGAYILVHKVTSGVWSEILSLYMGRNWFNTGIAMARSSSAFTTARSGNGGSSWNNNIGGDFTGMTDDIKVTILSQHTGGEPAVTHLVNSFEMVSGEVVVAGNWPVHVVAIGDSSRNTLGYADVPSIETNEPVDIIEWPY